MKIDLHVRSHLTHAIQNITTYSYCGWERRFISIPDLETTTFLLYRKVEEERSCGEAFTVVELRIVSNQTTTTKTG